MSASTGPSHVPETSADAPRPDVAVGTTLTIWTKSVWGRMSMAGLVVGAICFALSLTPSLLPRTPVIQGILSGCVFAIGYAIGAIIQWVWKYLELKLPERQWVHWLKWGTAAFCCALVALFLFLYGGWQNSVREAMGLDPMPHGEPLLVFLVALLPAVIFVVLGTLVTRWVQWMSRKLLKYVPPRVAGVGGLIIVGVFTAFLFSGVLMRGLLDAADNLFLQLDAATAEFGGAPTNPLDTGSASSLVPWGSLGHDGKLYIQTRVTKDEIEAVTGKPAIEPLRTYVGLRSAETVEERAQLALAEMKRVGAFDRDVVVIIMPVGTGWVDPAGTDSLEYLQSGDVATVAVQYSYLTSPLSLLVEPDSGTGTAAALFDAIHGYWRTLPPETRPRLYLQGLSLGSHASEGSTQFFDIVGEPFDGALWAGPPFTSSVWRFTTSNRVPDSPEWRPIYGDSSSVRFANHGTDLMDEGDEWGPMRIAFLQHSSDPIVFFSIASLFNEPAWMIGERGADVPDSFTWYPVITFFQLAMDMALAQAVSPPGYGHVYSGSEYVAAWTAIAEVDGWTDDERAAIAEAVETKAASMR